MTRKWHSPVGFLALDGFYKCLSWRCKNSVLTLAGDCREREVRQEVEAVKAEHRERLRREEEQTALLESLLEEEEELKAIEAEQVGHKNTWQCALHTALYN